MLVALCLNFSTHPFHHFDEMDRGRSVGCFRGVDGRTNIGSSATNCYTTLSYKFTRSILGIESQNLKLDEKKYFCEKKD